jgi:hypothetical protein
MAILLLSNPELEVLSFDIWQHNYVKDIANYYKNKYNFTFVEGDSLITVKEYNNDKNMILYILTVVTMKNVL